jgi:hypothetical protein
MWSFRRWIALCLLRIPVNRNQQPALEPTTAGIGAALNHPLPMRSICRVVGLRYPAYQSLPRWGGTRCGVC